MSGQPARVRVNPCATCPYRRGVPAGIWHPHEYAKLHRYDGETWTQSERAFYCHTGPEDICAGWAGHRDPADLLAVRLGIMDGNLHPSVAEYSTDVPLFRSGAEAAEHGLSGVDAPQADASAAIAKILRRREMP